MADMICGLAGGAQSDPLRAEVLSTRWRHEQHVPNRCERVAVNSLDSRQSPATPTRLIETADRLGVRYRASPQAGAPPRRQLPRVRGRDQASVLAPSCYRNPQPGMECNRRAAGHASQKMVLELLLRHAETHYTRNELDRWAAALGQARFASTARRSNPQRTCRTMRSRSISTPASSARAACAPAARSRSTT
jgi:hypothetical protein